jgi:hypothetical protein
MKQTSYSEELHNLCSSLSIRVELGRAYSTHWRDPKCNFSQSTSKEETAW